MALPLQEIGDAIVTALDTHFTDPTIVVQRRYIGTGDLGDITGLVVTVVPFDDVETLGTRKKDEHRYDFLIVFRIKMTGATDEGKTDQIDGLLEMVNDAMATLNRAEMAGAKWTGEVIHENLFEREHIQQWNQFTAIRSIKYVRLIEAA